MSIGAEFPDFLVFVMGSGTAEWRNWVDSWLGVHFPVSFGAGSSDLLVFVMGSGTGEGKNGLRPARVCTFPCHSGQDFQITWRLSWEVARGSGGTGLILGWVCTFPCHLGQNLRIGGRLSWETAQGSAKTDQNLPGCALSHVIRARILKFPGVCHGKRHKGEQNRPRSGLAVHFPVSINPESPNLQVTAMGNGIKGPAQAPTQTSPQPTSP
ncbi:hypothetical protein CPELA_10575 [Corynebacterium pelargi]|uniref:Uncharacterized protein n=1 Tax=Corynebacterium pelargi TaxID=1471400 RepID=A0A410WBM1_9CORY|nr:hypothetical protein CPELA_10575 [Corynebacterium pelargi]